MVLGSAASAEADALVRACVPRFDTPANDPILIAGGKEAGAACRELRALAFPRGLPTSEAVSTTAGELPARWLIHVAIPVYALQSDRLYQLTASYRSVLRVADELGARALALQPLGSAAPYWPLDQAIHAAFSTLLNSLTQVRETVLYVPTDQALQAYSEALSRQ